MRGWPIVFVLATCVAVAAAWAVNLGIGRLIAPDEPPPRPGAVAASSPVTGPARTRGLSLDEYLQGIMGRNLFDVKVIDTWKPVTATADGEPVAKSELHVKLLGTLVASPAEYSSAFILDEDAKDQLPKAYSVGQKLYDRLVKSIEEDRVALEKADGTIEYLTMGDGSLAVADAGETTTDAPTTEGISQSGENRYTVSKELFDKSISDMEGLSKMARALLHRGADGEYDGFRLSAIRRGSLAEQLGIKNGDIINSVNGEPLTSMNAAMGAYTTMKSQSNFCFEVSRRGTPVELCYDVR